MQFRFLSKCDDMLLIRIDELDLSDIEERLKNDIVWAENCIGRITDLNFPTECYENQTNGSWEHECPDCLASFEPIATCPFQLRQECERKLERLKLLDLPIFCLQDPKKAVAHRTLEGMAQESCIYRTS